ncbi:MAG: thiamine pyrophosphate-binding protein [Chlamydiales bacterium]|nr:thiamine pyrophosphate-binding protein [Chlamydiales bacterium]
MKIKEQVLKFICQQGVKNLFMIPGGLVDPFLTAFDSQPGVTPIVAAQEGGAAYMADGYARASKKFGVCLCIGGPGATNTTTAILAARSDLSPLLVISGEVPTSMEGIGAFQDASIVGLDDFDILKSATKYSVTIENPQLFHHHFQNAFTHLLSSNPAPVHICLPTNVQESDIPESLPPNTGLGHCPTLDIHAAEACLDYFQATKIVILAGQGVDSADGANALRSVCESLDIPVATTLRAKGVFPENHPLSLGVFGYAGTAHASKALQCDELDVLVVLGSGLNQRDSMYWSKSVAPKQAFIQVNCNPSAFHNNYKHSQLVLGDCRAFLELILSAKLTQNNARADWVKKITEGPRLYDVENLVSDAQPIHPARVIHDLREVAPKDTVLVVDSGAHRAFCGHYWTCYGPNEYISATNLGPMGWAIPAGIGAKLARPQQPCCVVTGDGCMLMHGMEIQTAARYNVPVVFVVINNAALGNVYLRAATLGTTPMELTSLPNHDWAMFAKSLGVSSETIENPADLKAAFTRAFTANKPYLLDIKCDKRCETPCEPFIDAKRAWSYHE